MKTALAVPFLMELGGTGGTGKVCSCLVANGESWGHCEDEAVQVVVLLAKHSSSISDMQRNLSDVGSAKDE